MDSSKPHERQQNTKDRILDTAEKLFALHGFAGTSLRAVTGEAGVNLAAVNYHFGSKTSLLEAVMERRITPLNQERLRMLDDAHANNTSISLRDIISCFIKPTLKLLDCGEQKRYFVQLVGRILAEQDGPEKEVFHRHMGPVLPPFISSIQELKPHLSMRTIVWGLHFNIGATTHCIRLFCNPKIFLTPDSVVDLETMEKMLIDFVTSGLETTYA